MTIYVRRGADNVQIKAKDFRFCEDCKIIRYYKRCPYRDRLADAIAGCWTYTEEAEDQ